MANVVAAAVVACVCGLGLGKCESCYLDEEQAQLK